jgi:hypothetical protein
VTQKKDPKELIMHAVAFPDETYRQVFGLKKQKDIEFAETIVGALSQIDRGLLPASAGHPLAGLIAAGTDSLEQLVTMVENGDEQQVLDGIDALSHVFLYTDVPVWAVKRLRSVMNTAGVTEHNPEKVALLAKCLAIGGDLELLQHQLRLLADEDPGVVATAARLIGLGRYEPAVPVLRELVSPDRLYESRAVIWALGEIGSRDALNQLEYALASGFRTVDCMIAMGKIGTLTSIPKLTPMMLSGLPEQRDAAYRALAMILDKNRGLIRHLEPLPSELTRLITQQLNDADLPLSGSVRFHMCLCLARLGEKLDAARVRKYLNLSLDEKEASDMAGFFMRKGGEAKSS